MCRADLDSQALPRVFVHDRQHLQRTTVTRPIGDEVVGPDVIPVLRSKADAGAIAQPQAASFRLFLRHFQTLSTPQALDPLVVDSPAVPAQQPGDAAVAVTAISRRQIDHLLHQTVLVLRRQRSVPLGRASLTQDQAGPALRYTWSLSRACSTARRRRAGLRIFPRPPLSESNCPGSDPPRPSSAGRSLARDA